MKKVMITVMITGTSVLSFAQVNLGLQSTTQAALNATAAATAASKATVVASQVTNTVVTAGLNKTAQATTSATSAANTTTKQGLATTGEIKKDVKNAANVSAGARVSSSSQTKAQAGDASKPANASTNSEINTGAGLTVDGSRVIGKAESSAASTTKPVLENAQAVKEQTKPAIQSNVKTTGQTISTVKPSAGSQASAETTSATQASIADK